MCPPWESVQFLNRSFCNHKKPLRGATKSPFYERLNIFWDIGRRVPFWAKADWDFSKIAKHLPRVTRRNKVLISSLTIHLSISILSYASFLITSQMINLKRRNIKLESIFLKNVWWNSYSFGQKLYGLKNGNHFWKKLAYSPSQDKVTRSLPILWVICFLKVLSLTLQKKKKCFWNTMTLPFYDSKYNPPS